MRWGGGSTSTPLDAILSPMNALKFAAAEKGFIFAVLGTLVLTALVLNHQLAPEMLLVWLGGAAGPTMGRLGKGAENVKE